MVFFPPFLKVAQLIESAKLLLLGRKRVIYIVSFDGLLHLQHHLD